jgi:hypothetical protein
LDLKGFKFKLSGGIPAISMVISRPLVDLDQVISKSFDHLTALLKKWFK